MQQTNFLLYYIFIIIIFKELLLERVQVWQTAADETAAEEILTFFFYSFQRKCRDISCESSAKQTIHMQCQDLFPQKMKKKKKRMSSAANFV